jgi:hypothetical protein
MWTARDMRYALFTVDCVCPLPPHCPPTAYAPPPNIVTSVLLYCLLTSGLWPSVCTCTKCVGWWGRSGQWAHAVHRAWRYYIGHTGLPTTAAAACSTHLAMTLSMSSIGTNTSRSWSCGMKSPAVWVRSGSKIQVVACSSERWKLRTRNKRGGMVGDGGSATATPPPTMMRESRPPGLSAE